MKLIEAIKKCNLKLPVSIMYRITLPPDLVEECGHDDTLLGYCEWDGKEIISLDGDSYSLDDEILEYSIVETKSGESILSVLVFGDWICVGTNFADDEAEEDGDETIRKDKRRAKRRHNDFKKAVRKRKLAREIYPSFAGDNWEYYHDLHTYSKNKIHCSCPMCSEKTNGKKQSHSNGARGAGAMVYGTTNHRMGDNFKPSEKKKIDEINSKLKEFDEDDKA